MDERVPEPPLDAEHPHAGLVVGVVEHTDDAFALVNLALDAAANTAVGASGGHAPGDVLNRALDLDRARRTDGQALAAGGAHRLDQRSVHEGADAAALAAAQEVNGADELVPVLTGPGRTAAAQDAVGHGDIEDRVAVIYGLALSRRPARTVEVVVLGGDGQLAVVSLDRAQGRLERHCRCCRPWPGSAPARHGGYCGPGACRSTPPCPRSLGPSRRQGSLWCPRSARCSCGRPRWASCLGPCRAARRTCPTS